MFWSIIIIIIIIFWIIAQFVIGVGLNYESLSIIQKIIVGFF
jgi:hypothetical protein